MKDNNFRKTPEHCPPPPQPRSKQMPEQTEIFKSSMNHIFYNLYKHYDTKILESLSKSLSTEYFTVTFNTSVVTNEFVCSITPNVGTILYRQRLLEQKEHIDNELSKFGDL